MKLSQFKFEVDLKLIPHNPKENRDDSRMMVVHRKTGEIEHRMFRDILDYFTEDDVMVVNNSKVFPARLYGKKEKTGASIEVFLLRELDKNNRLWDVIVEPARKIRVGNKLYFGENDELVAEVIDNTTSRGRTIKFMFNGNADEFREALFGLGETPIPKYFDRKPTELDDERYQTIYAKREGSVAAPTAGLHFSREIIKRLEIEGVNFTEITLHTGLSSFRPIEVEDLSKHKMDAEYFQVYDHTCEVVNHAKKLNKKICAVGTTSLRALESSITASGMLKPQENWTNMFIHPPFEFQVANSLLTNFHLPKTSLQVNVAAFAGFDLAQKAYEIAKKEKYGWFTFGDAMLIL